MDDSNEEGQELTVTCRNCGAQLPSRQAHETEMRSCPDCGCREQIVALKLCDRISGPHEMLKGKMKDTTLPAKKNPRVEIKSGDELYKCEGKWVHKERVIDKDKDLYTETIVDPETGKVIHHCSEPLSQHRGHGSAKNSGPSTTLRFLGTVKSGLGKHSRLAIPGSGKLNGRPPPGWPPKFIPGSLNILVDDNGYPAGFAEIEGDRLAKLDTGAFPPAIMIPATEISGNTLKPKPGMPRRGAGQFWPARISVSGTDKTACCWLFRRVGSSIKQQLELVSGVVLRKELLLTDGVHTIVDVKFNSSLDHSVNVG